MVVKVVMFTLLWFVLIAGIGYALYKYKMYNDEVKTQRLKARYERDMKALEIAEREYEEGELYK